MIVVAGVVAGIVVAGILVYTVLPEDGGIPGETTVAFNGQEFEWDEMKSNFTVKTIGDDEGVALSDIVNDTQLQDPDNYTYVLTADDGYAMAVNWTEMQNGILTLQEEDKDNETVTYLMTVFPNLPSGYKVRYLANITHEELVPIVLNGLEYYLDYMPKRVSEATIQHNETTSFTGFRLGDMVNYTGLENPENCSYILWGSDGYHKTVDWDTMMSGLLVEEDTMSYFPDEERSFWVKDIIEIEVE